MSWLILAGLSNAAVAAVLAVGIFALSRIIRNPAIVHGMWVVVLLKLVTPPLFELPLPISHPLLETTAQEPVVVVARAEASLLDAEGTSANAEPAEVHPSAKAAMGPAPPDAESLDGDVIVFREREEFANFEESIEAEADSSFLAAPEPIANQPVTTSSPATNDQLAGEEPARAGFAHATVASPQTQLALAIALWLTGAVVMLLVILFRAHQFQWLLRSSIRDSSKLGREVRRLARAAGVRRPPRVFLVSGSVSPMLWPLGMRPAILFPADLAESLDRRSRETLLLHELAHYGRGDHWVRLLEVVAVCLHWWNPLVWWVRREIHRVEEDCCDAWVVAQRPESRTVYARALMEAIDFLSEAAPALPPTASGIGYLDSVKRRLEFIMRGRPSRGLSLTGKLAVAVFALAIAPLLPTLTAAPPEETRPARRSDAQDRPDDAEASAAAPGEVEDQLTSGDGLPAAEPYEFENQAIVLLDEPAQIRAVAFSPDGKFAASGGGDYKTPGELVVWNLESGEEMFTLPYPRGVRSVAWSPNGKLLAAGTFTKTVELIDPKTGETIASLDDFDGAVNSVAFSPDGSLLAAGSLDKSIKLYTTETRKLVRTLSGHTDWIFFIAFSSDGKSLASCGRDKTLRIWNVATGEQRLSIETGREGECVKFSPDDKKAAVALWDGSVKLYSADSGDELATLTYAERIGAGLTATLAFSPDGKTLLAAGSSQTVKSWDVATQEPNGEFRAHDQMIWSLAFSPDGARLLTGGDDRIVKLWDVAEEKELSTLVRRQNAEDRPEPILAIAWSPDGSTVATSHEDLTIRLRDAESGVLRHVLRGHEDVASGLAFSPDGKTLATVAADDTVRLWNVVTGRVVRVLKGHTNWVFAIAFSHDGKMLASGGYDKTIRLWDVASGKLLATLEGHDAAVRSLSFSPDDRLLASGGSDRTVRLWNVESRQEAAKLTGHEGAVRAVAFSPDGALLASASEDKTVRLWNPQAKSEIRTLSGHQDMVWSLAFSPGGSTLASGGFDNEIKLWDPTNGALRQTLSGHTEVVASLAFAPDTSALASAGYDRTIRIWKSKGPPLPAASALAMIRDSQNNLLAIAVSPDAKLLAAAGKNKAVVLRDLRTGKVVKTLDVSNAAVSDLAFSPDSKTLAVGTYGPRLNLSIWDVATGQKRFDLLGHTEGVRDITFSPDGRLLASGSWDKTVRLWNVKTQELLRVTAEQSLPISGVAFSPDGGTFATSTGNWKEWREPGEVKLWDTKSGRELRTIGRHPFEIKGLFFEGSGDRLISFGSGTTRQWDLTTDGAEASSLLDGRTITAAVPLPDGRRAAFGELSGTITVVDLETRKPLLRFAGHTENVFGLACSADGSLLVSLSRDGSIRLWPTSPRGSSLSVNAGRYIHDTSVSPDGKTILCSCSGFIKLFDLTNGNLVREFAAPREVKHTGIAFTPDGLRAVSCGDDNIVRVWDVASGDELMQLKGHQDELRCMAVSPVGATAATAGLGKTVILWDLSSGRLLRRLEGHRRSIWSLAYSPDGKMLASGGQLDARLWDVATGESLQTLTVGSQMNAVTFALDGKSLLTGQNDGSLSRWDVETGKLLWRRVAHTARVTGACLTPDGRHLLTGGLDGDVYRWELERDAPPIRIGTHSPASPEKNRVTALALSPDATAVVSAGADGVLRLWSSDRPEGESSSDLVRRWRPAGFTPLSKLTLRRTLSPSFAQAWFAIYSPDGKWLAVGGRTTQRQLILYDAATLEEAARIDAGHPLVMHSVFSPDGRRLAIGAGAALKIWNVQRREFESTMRGHSKGIRMIAFSPDGRRVATAGDDGKAIVWDPDQGKQLFSLKAENNLAFYCVAFSPDGRLLATGGGDWRARKKMEVHLWDAASGELLKQLPDSKEVTAGLAFSPDGRLLAARSADVDLALWDVATGEQVTKYRRLPGTRSVTFSPDGRRLAACSATNSGIVSIIDRETSQLIAQTKAHDNNICQIHFSPDGGTLTTASFDGTVKLWTMEDIPEDHVTKAE